MTKLETVNKVLDTIPILNRWIYSNGFDVSDFSDEEYAEMLTDLINGELEK